MYRNIVFIWFLVLIAAQAQADNLTLAQCLDEALKNNYTLRQLQANLDAAQANAAYSSRSRLPQFIVSGSYLHLSDVDPFTVTLPFAGAGTITIAEPVLDAYSMSIGFQQPLFTGFRLKNQANMSDQLAMAAQLQFEAGRQQLIYDVTRAYYLVIQAQDSQRLIEESLATVQNHLQDVKNMFSAGLTTQNDVLQVEVQVSNTELQFVQAKTRLQIARIQLANLMGRLEIQEITPQDNVQIEVRKITSLDSLLTLACENRTELKAMTHQLEAAKNGIGIARSNYFPALTAVGSYNYSSPNQRYQPPKDDFHDDWQIGVVAQFTPFDWGRTGQKVREAKAGQARANAQWQQTRQRVQYEVTEAYLRHQEVLTRLELVRTGLARAEENLKVARDQFRNGMATNSDVLDAETNLLKAQLDQAGARVDYLITLALLNRSVGTNDH